MLDRLRSWFDAPRFCPDCGEPIRVENQPRYHQRTGAPIDRWVWRCPHRYVELSEHQVITSWYGDKAHVWGHGRPRWARDG